MIAEARNRYGTSRATRGYVPIIYHPINHRLVRQLPASLLRAHKVVPLARDGDLLRVAMADPDDREAVAKIRQLMACQVQPVLTSSAEIDVILATVLGADETPDIEPALLYVLLNAGALTVHQAASLKQARLASQSIEGGDEPGGILTEEEYTEALALVLYVPRLRLDSCHIDPAFAHIVPQDLAERWQVVALFPLTDREMVVASSGLLPHHVLRSIESLTGFRPVPVLSTKREVQRAIQHAYGIPAREAKRSSKPLWRQLLDDGAINHEQLAAARMVEAQTGEPVEQVLLRLGHVNEVDLLQAHARLHNTELIRLSKIPIDMSVAQVLPEPLARRYRCLPCRKLERYILAATVDLENQEAEGLLKALFRQPIRLALCSEAEMEEAFETVYRQSPQPTGQEDPPLSEYLRRSGRLTADEVDKALQRQRETGESLEKCLLELGLLDETGLVEMLALRYRKPWVDVSRYSPPAETRDLLPQEIARQHCVEPLYRDGRLLTVAIADPQDETALEAVRQHAGLDVRAVLAGEDSLRRSIDRIYEMDLSRISEELRSFGASLVRAGLLSHEQLLAVWHRHLQADVPFDVAVTALGFLSEDRLARAMAEYLGTPQIDLRPRRVPVKIVDAVGAEREILRWAEVLDLQVSRLLPEETARRLGAIAVRRSGDAILVAFVNPIDEAIRRQVEEQLRRRVSPGVCTRTQLTEAIERVYGRQMLGELLLQADAINRRQLEEGLELQRRIGVRLGEALVSLGHITREQLVASLSVQRDMPYFSLCGVEIEEDVARSVPESFARARGLIPLARTDDTIIVAMTNPSDAEAIAEVQRLTGCRVEPVITTEDDIEEALERIYRDEYLWQSANELVFRYPEDSAIRVLTTRQKAFILAFLALSALLIALNPMAYFTALVGLCTLFYVSFSTYKFYLIYKAISHRLEIDVTPEEVAALDDRDLPVYTVLVPLYREAEILPTLIRAIDDLDYPKAKLDIKLLLEEDDEETLAAVQRHPLPAHFKPVIVPNSPPRGKPKACNYGLIHAEGEFVVIYDAEDIPEPDQLKKAVLGFRKANSRVQCIQAKLNYFNRDQNLLTRWFTTEYSMWFDLFIPGLDASNAPIPLGGTSNHFRTLRLKELGAWDPYNVTEDADLGVRLFKAGWKTAVIDSTTYEEANSELYNWIRQRSRWVKGYIQTYLVHMRHPLKLLRDIGPYQFFSFNMVVGGTFFGFLMNPVYWLLTAAWFLTRWDIIQQLFPAPVFYVGALGLYLGNFAFTYSNVIGCLKRQYYEMAKYALLSPLYWALMSIGAWKGFIQLFYRPSYWEKTVHGLYKGETPLGTAGHRT